MNNYKILYHFESEVFSLIEIKRTLQNETDKSKLYFWLLFDKQEVKLQKLNFVSMSSDEENEFREFENIRLSFDKQKALLISGNKEFKLQAIPTKVELNGRIQQAIREFF